MSEGSAKKNILDIATTLTVGGIVLYQMGWAYWTAYFHNFNINSSFIEMPFEKFIATTWYISIIVFFAFITGALHLFENKEEQIDFIMGTICIVISVVTLLSKFLSDVTFLMILTCLIVLLFLYFFALFKNRIQSNTIGRTKFLYILLVIMYILSFVIYTEKADTDAKKVIQNFKKADIEIFFNDKSRGSGKFIAYMNNKYFIIVKDKKGKIQTVVLNDTEVHHVKFIQ